MSEKATMTKLGESLEAARTRIGERDFEGAWQLLTQARKEHLEGADPNEQEELHYCLGVSLNGLARPAEAIPQLNRSLHLAEANKSVSGQARSLEELGGAHHQRGQSVDLRSAEGFYDRAFKLYQKLEDKPGQARNLRNLGGVRVDIGLMTAAQKDYEAARELFKELGDSEGVASCVTNSSLLLYRTSGRQAAINEYLRSLEAGEGEHYLVLNNLGFLLMLEKKFAEARPYLERGRDDCVKREVTDDNAGLLWLNLGILSTLENKLDEADSELDKAEKCFEEWPSGRAVEIVLLPPEAVAKGQEPFFATEDGDKRSVTVLNRAMVAAQRQDRAKALELTRRAIELDPQSAYPYAVLGWLHVGADEEAEATQAFRKACGLEPHNAMFKASLDAVNPYLSSKAGRNDPCPCGSGKKFKKCHGALK